MLVRAAATVISITQVEVGLSIITTEYGPAIAYTDIVGPIVVGDSVIINRTANELNLGTGGCDFVMAICSDQPHPAADSGHIVKLRYTPSQLAVDVLEQRADLENIWDENLQGTPVVICQLHSQIAHAAAAVYATGKRAVYIMTDTACLAGPFSNLVRQLKTHKLIFSFITSGQCFGGDYETVTVHSALLAAKHFLKADVIIIGQGPGNAGTGTKYGFSGIDQASLIDIVTALQGTPIAVLRASDGDPRLRHRGISHHSLTALRLARSSCTIPVPEGMIITRVDDRHKLVTVTALLPAFDILDQFGIEVTTMGRNASHDRIFFETAAAAGKYASEFGDN